MAWTGYNRTCGILCDASHRISYRGIGNVYARRLIAIICLELIPRAPQREIDGCHVGVGSGIDDLRCRDTVGCSKINDAVVRATGEAGAQIDFLEGVVSANPGLRNLDPPSTHRLVVISKRKSWKRICRIADPVRRAVRKWTC